MTRANAFVDRVRLAPGVAARGALWAEHISSVFDVAAYGSAAERAPISMTNMLCDRLIYSRFRAPPSKVVRTATKLSKQGIDHVHVQFYDAGRSVVRAGSASARVGPGQMVVFDLAQPVEVEAEAVSAISLVLPRNALEEHAGDPAALHGQVFDIGACSVRRMLYRYLSCLDAEAAAISVGELAAVSTAALALYTSCLPRSGPARQPGGASRKLAIRQHVEEHLASARLSVAAVCERFHLSRSSLQRMFESEGGFASYVRERRLQRAFRTLARSDAGAPRYVVGVALDCGFGDVSAFSRAFARRFGMPPSRLFSARLGETAAPDARAPLSRWVFGL